MTADLDPWRPGWDLEPCDTATPDEQAFTDIHGEQAKPRAYRPVKTIQLKGTLL